MKRFVGRSMLAVVACLLLVPVSAPAYEPGTVTYEKRYFGSDASGSVRDDEDAMVSVTGPPVGSSEWQFPATATWKRRWREERYGVDANGDPCTVVILKTGDFTVPATITLGKLSDGRLYARADTQSVGEEKLYVSESGCGSSVTREEPYRVGSYGAETSGQPTGPRVTGRNTITSAGLTETRSFDLPNPASDDPVERYAPALFFHKACYRTCVEEEHFPYSTVAFINNSELEWESRNRCRRRIDGRAHKQRGTIDAAKLGARTARPYLSDRIGRGCRTPKTGPRFRASEHTRPYDPGRPKPLNQHAFRRDGFALDLANQKRPGYAHPRLAPLYYETGSRRDGGSWITYWFFYAYSTFRDLQRHEGDWERMSVLLDAEDQPEAVAYYAHGGAPRVWCWDSLEKTDGTHPHGYVAVGSHATYRRPGRYDVDPGPFEDLANGKGAQWEPWKGLLRDAARQPWYGYGGAWGQVSRQQVAHQIEFTGPTGPGPKSAKPPEKACS